MKQLAVKRNIRLLLNRIRREFAENMFETIKKNGKVIEKIIVNQIGMTMFGCVLFIASSAVGQNYAGMEKAIKLGTSIFSALFYLVLLYVHAHDEGLKDQVRIESGRMKKQPLKMLWLSLVANSLNIIVGIIMAISYFFTKADLSVFFSKVIEITELVFRVTEGMYLGIFSVLAQSGNTFALFVPILCVVPSLVVLTFGYIIGTKGGLKCIFREHAGK